ADMRKSTFDHVDFDWAYIDKTKMEKAVFYSPANTNKINHISIVLENEMVLAGVDAVNWISWQS
ncbi:MAG: hypothetical protein IJ181_07865, partial [Acidaminococcaceae bacterium]|nr:hypothetical protein [Acidaminococcaceae bacterium]